MLGERSRSLFSIFFSFTFLPCLSFLWEQVNGKDRTNITSVFPLSRLCPSSTGSPGFPQSFPQPGWFAYRLTVEAGRGKRWGTTQGPAGAVTAGRLIWGELYSSRLYNPRTDTGVEAQRRPALVFIRAPWGARLDLFISARSLDICVLHPAGSSHQAFIPSRSGPLVPSLAMGTGGAVISSQITLPFFFFSSLHFYK